MSDDVQTETEMTQSTGDIASVVPSTNEHLSSTPCLLRKATSDNRRSNGAWTANVRGSSTYRPKSSASMSTRTPVAPVGVDLSIGDHVFPRRPTSLPMYRKDEDAVKPGRRPASEQRGDFDESPADLVSTKNVADLSGRLGDVRWRSDSDLPAPAGTSAILDL